MSFQELLNVYMARLNCTVKELADVSGISASAISRYRAGHCRPELDGEQWGKLIDGLALLAKNRDLTELKKPGIDAALRAALPEEKILDSELFQRNLNDLLDMFTVNNNELARYLNYDASYISRIRSGHRVPRDVDFFAYSVGVYLSRRCQSDAEREKLKYRIGVDLPDDATHEDYAQAAARFLCSNRAPAAGGNVDDFLRKVDAFDLGAYIRAVHFDEMTAPSGTASVPDTRFYIGLPELMNAQLAFLRMTAASPSDRSVTMYSDLSMSEMSQDPAFPKDWMVGMATMLQKGLRLNMIHNVDRPFHEMMLGLESFIPIYMTGQISPFYLSGSQNSAFRNLLWVSGNAALQGGCITGHIHDGKVYLTSRESEVAHYQRMAKQLLKRASPLMDIYGQNRKTAFDRFLEADKHEAGARRTILSSLPIYTLSDDLAQRILRRNHISDQEQLMILNHIHAEQRRIEQILEHSALSDLLPVVSEREYSRYPMGLSLAGMFYPGDVRLTYEEYLAYMDLCFNYERGHPGYSCSQDRNTPFRNIQISILEKGRVIVTKNKHPVIHFVIRHPKMCAAIEDMIIPVMDS